MTYYWDMDGVLADFHTAYATDRATALKKDAMANLLPFMANVVTLRNLILAGHTCYILTKAANEAGAQGKVEWLAKYVPARVARSTTSVRTASSSMTMPPTPGSGKKRVTPPSC